LITVITIKDFCESQSIVISIILFIFFFWARIKQN